MVIFWLSSVESSRCAANWQTRVWKLKFKMNKLVDLRNLYPNIAVFGLELLVFWNGFRIWTWKYRFSKFLKIWFFPPKPTPCICMRGEAASSKGDDHEISPFLASKSYQNINFDQIKNRDINLMIIYLIFYQNCNFLAAHVNARSRNGDFVTIFGRKQPMRCELANWSLKAKIQIEQIGGFTKSLSECGRVWTWITYFLKGIANMNLKISISNIFENLIFLPLTHTVHLNAWRSSSKGGDHEISPFLCPKKLPEY